MPDGATRLLAKDHCSVHRQYEDSLLLGVDDDDKMTRFVSSLCPLLGTKQKGNRKSGGGDSDGPTGEQNWMDGGWGPRKGTEEALMRLVKQERDEGLSLSAGSGVIDHGAVFASADKSKGRLLTTKDLESKVMFLYSVFITV